MVLLDEVNKATNWFTDCIDRFVKYVNKLEKAGNGLTEVNEVNPEVPINQGTQSQVTTKVERTALQFKVLVVVMFVFEIGYLMESFNAKDIRDIAIHSAFVVLLLINYHLFNRFFYKFFSAGNLIGILVVVAAGLSIKFFFNPAKDIDLQEFVGCFVIILRDKKLTIDELTDYISYILLQMSKTNYRGKINLKDIPLTSVTANNRVKEKILKLENKLLDIENKVIDFLAGNFSDEGHEKNEVKQQDDNTKDNGKEITDVKQEEVINKIIDAKYSVDHVVMVDKAKVLKNSIKELRELPDKIKKGIYTAEEACVKMSEKLSDIQIQFNDFINTVKNDKNKSQHAKVNDIVDSIKEVLNEIHQNMRQLNIKAKDKAGDVINKAKDKVEDVVKNIETSDVGEQIKQKVTEVAEKTKNKVQDVAEVVRDKVHDAKELVKDTVAAAKNKLNEINSEELVNKITAAVNEAASNETNDISYVRQDIKAFVNLIIGKLSAPSEIDRKNYVISDNHRVKLTNDYLIVTNKASVTTLVLYALWMLYIMAFIVDKTQKDDTHVQYFLLTFIIVFALIKLLDILINFYKK